MSGNSSFFQPGSLGLSQGDRGDTVRRLQNYLQRFGYLRSEDRRDPYAAYRSANAPGFDPGVFDAGTRAGLVAFQRYHGIEQTGILDGPTAAFLSLPRCGVPDTPYSLGIRLAGDAWPSPPSPNLRYAIVNTTADIALPAAISAIEQALQLWASVTPLTFTPAPLSDNPEILIGFYRGDHNDGVPFDGPGNTVAHAFYPPPGVAFPGDTHFDEDETWTVTIPNPPGTFDLVTVAIHEFGHAIGLTHSSDPASVMFATYAGLRRSLSLDDIRRAQALYGGPPVPPPPPPPVAPWDDPAVRALIDEWIQQMDRCVKRVYPGAYIDQWGRLCGRLPTTIAFCNQNPDVPPGWTSYRYLWVQNFAPTFYPYTLYQYVDLRRAGTSFAQLAICTQ